MSSNHPRWDDDSFRKEQAARNAKRRKEERQRERLDRWDDYFRHALAGESGQLTQEAFVQWCASVATYALAEYEGRERMIKAGGVVENGVAPAPEDVDAEGDES